MALFCNFCDTEELNVLAILFFVLGSVILFGIALSACIAAEAGESTAMQGQVALRNNMQQQIQRLQQQLDTL